MNEITIEAMNELLDERSSRGAVPRENFLAYNPCSNSRVAVDNTTNDFWMEEFKSPDEAIARINGKFEIN